MHLMAKWVSMSLPHFYLEDQVLSQEIIQSFELRLSSDDLKHARALRLKSGEHIAVLDASNDYFECCVDSFDKQSLCVHIAQHLEVPRRPTVVLAQGLAKGDKMDTIIRHATELGVSAFIPLLCERSIVKLDQKKIANRMQRWNALAKSAAMQSGQAAIPEICEPQTINGLMEQVQGATAVLVCWEEAAGTQTLSSALESACTSLKQPYADARVVVVVGPEGGLSEHEVQTLQQLHPQCFPITLGPTILRTETAGIVAPALVLYELERG